MAIDSSIYNVVLIEQILVGINAIFENKLKITRSLLELMVKCFKFIEFIVYVLTNVMMHCGRLVTFRTAQCTYCKMKCDYHVRYHISFFFFSIVIKLFIYIVIGIYSSVFSIYRVSRQDKANLIA